jgi:hypothetical protein
MRWNQTLAVTASMLLFATVSPCQPQTTKAAQPVTKTFSVNGKPVQTSLVQIDNRLYVALDDLASSLDCSLTTKATSIDLTVPASNNNQNISSSDAASGTGTVKGVFTYYFNANYGSRPDVGAKVWIVKGGGINIPDQMGVMPSSLEMILMGEDNQRTTLSIVARAVADGTGSVTLPNIPTGVYTVVMQSDHAKAVNTRDILGKFRTSTIRISAGQVEDVSTDFGPSQTEF